MPFADLLTAEKHRTLRREHERMHPDGLVRGSGRVCDVCLLLAALEAAYRRLPRCSANTERGFRCARTAGHTGAHSHPNDETPIKELFDA